MIEILNRCESLEAEYKNEAQRDNILCDGNNINTPHCYECLSSGFYTNTKDTYDCPIKLSLYTINYGPIYVSEIYHFLKKSQLLENNFLDITRPIEIMSLGCGFGPDDIALTKYSNDEQLDIDFNYVGYDIESWWNTITNTNALPIIYDVLNGFDCNNVDILFINKLFSTLKNHNLDGQFLTELQVALQSLPNGAFVIFNDINYWEMGRDDFNQFAIANSLEVIGKYYFNIEGAYSANYTEIPYIDNICEIPHNFTHSPKLTVNKSIFFLYQKVV